MDEKKIPTGRLGRLARLAATTVRTGAGMLLETDGALTARQAADALGHMRGVAAKVGQMLGYVDGLVPESQRDAYEVAMRTLRAAAPTSSVHEIRAQVEADLGASIETLFQSWDDVPFASASIGQVHRAVLHDGREVAVKVQHPGIERAVESDLSNATVLQSLVSFAGGRKLDSDAMFEAIRARFREELDYQLEAKRQTEFSRIHAGDSSILIPAVIADRSSRRVLTTELVSGLSFEQACLASDHERHAWCETLWRCVFKAALVGGMFNADPHPGNYFFQANGRVAFLDFGCVQAIPLSHQAAARKLHHAANVHDADGFRQAVREMLQSRPGRLEETAIAFIAICFQPLERAPFLITRSYAASLVEAAKSMTLMARKVTDAERFTMSPEMVFMNRLQFGFYSVLARLNSTVDYAAVERGFMPEFAKKMAPSAAVESTV